MNCGSVVDEPLKRQKKDEAQAAPRRALRGKTRGKSAPLDPSEINDAPGVE